MRLNLIRAVLLMMTLSGAAACAADLDCRNVRTGVEKLICTTPELRAMDEDLTALSHLIDATADAKHQSAARQHWRSQLNRCLGRVQCVRANYISRVSDLLGSSRLKLPEAAHADMGHATVRLRSGWVIDDRDGQAPSKACVQTRDYLNREAGSWWRQSDNLYFNYCAAGASNGPLFQLPPWETLDPQEHMTLLMALLRYRDEKQHLVRDSVLHDEEYYRKEASQFIAQGGMLKLWTTHLFDRLDDPVTKQIVVTVGQAQHIAQLEFPMPTTGDTQYRSAGCKSGDVNEAMFLLSDDLKGPSTLNPTELRDRKLRLYRGQPVLIYADIAEFTLNFPLPAPEPQYCSVRFIKDLED